MLDLFFAKAQPRFIEALVCFGVGARGSTKNVFRYYQLAFPEKMLWA